jgi:hypothetical protein
VAPINAGMDVSTPWMERGDAGISSTYTPGVLYSGIELI